MTAIIANSIKLTVNGTPLEGVTEVSYGKGSEQQVYLVRGYESFGSIDIRRSRGWYRFLEAVLHAANLRNPRWLKRRARMKRKHKRGWA